jgi:PhzF family phenazine biosynthesis protein
MQSIAAENNLSETAFYIPAGLDKKDTYSLRWFTPAVEVDLCGHATLATAHTILDIRQETDAKRLTFETLSGLLHVDRDGRKYVLDLPSRPPQECEVHPSLIPALGINPEKILAARDYLCVLPSEEDVLGLRPDMQKLCEIDRFAVIVTAPGRNSDFVSRFFAPAKGVPEDPVTGSAHCTLIPYWVERLGRNSLFARQVSTRGGELWCELRGDRVRIGGEAVHYLEGFIETGFPLDMK